MGREQRIRVVIPYEPRAAFLPLHNRRQRWGIMVAHRRAGKTVACVNELNKAAITCTKPDGRFSYVAPYFNQAKDIAWTYLKRYATPIPGVQVNESELRIDYPNGARARLYGADNADRLRGGYLDGVILDEYADMHPSAWGEVIRPMLADRQGWALFIGTPKGRNDFYERWVKAQADPEWFTLMLKASQSGLLNADELAAARLEMTPEQFAQEFECSFDSAILGAYYGIDVANAEREGRICALPADPALKVHTAFDLGKDDPTAIWFWQVAPNGIRVIDYYENNGVDLDHYAAEIKARGYNYGTHWLPHDAKAEILGMKRTRIEQLRALLPSHEFRVVPNHTRMDGINAARMMLKRTWFDAERCRFGIEALRQYHAEYDEKAKVFMTTPKHDWSSHCADAFRYLAMSWREMKAVVDAPPVPTELIYTADPATGQIRGNMSVRQIVERKAREARLRRGA